MMKLTARQRDDFKSLLGCDEVRISQPGKRAFLIIGFKRRSDGEWQINGKPHDFDYLEEKCVASGETVEELTDSAKLYKRLCGMTWEDVFADPGLCEKLTVSKP